MDRLLEYHGLTLSEEGRHEDAEKIFRKALRLLYNKKICLFPDIQLISLRKHELADQLAHLGKIKSAGKNYMEAVDDELSYAEKDIYDSYYGVLGICKILTKYSNLLVESGNYKKVEKIYLDILGTDVRFRLRKHPIFFMSLSVVLLIDLSELQYRCGETKKSEKIFNKAIKVSQKLVNKTNSSNADLVEMVLKNIAGRQIELGQKKDVLKTYQILIELKRNFDYSDLSNYIGELADLYKEYGFFEEAKKLYLEELTLSKKELEDDPFLVFQD